MLFARIQNAKTIIRRFELHVFPVIGDIPVAKLTKTHVADLLTNIVKRDTLEIAKRIGQITRQVLEYASDKGVIDAIPMGNTKNLLPARKASSAFYPQITSQNPCTRVRPRRGAQIMVVPLASAATQV